MQERHTQACIAAPPVTGELRQGISNWDDSWAHEHLGTNVIQDKESRSKRV
jgi:hypothetical protein